MIMQLMQNSANTLCINEADPFTYPKDEKTIELIKLFITCGYKGIVLKCGLREPPHVLSEVVNMPESNCWHDTSQQRANIGAQHSECSDAFSDSRRIAPILIMILPHPTVWQPPDHPCSQIKRSTSERDCRHAPSYKDTARTMRLSSSKLSRTMSSVAQYQNPQMLHPSIFRQSPCDKS